MAPTSKFILVMWWQAFGLRFTEAWRDPYLIAVGVGTLMIQPDWGQPIKLEGLADLSWLHTWMKGVAADSEFAGEVVAWKCGAITSR